MNVINPRSISLFLSLNHKLSFLPKLIIQQSKSIAQRTNISPLSAIGIELRWLWCCCSTDYLYLWSTQYFLLLINILAECMHQYVYLCCYTYAAKYN